MSNTVVLAKNQAYSSFPVEKNRPYTFRIQWFGSNSSDKEVRLKIRGNDLGGPELLNLCLNDKNKVSTFRLENYGWETLSFAAYPFSQKKANIEVTVVPELTCIATLENEEE